MHACAKAPSKIYSLIDSARDYSSSARGRGSSQNGAIVNDGGMWCASAASRAGLMYSVGRNGPSTSSWTPHFRTRRSDVVPVPLPTPSYVDAYAFRVARASRSRQPASMPPNATFPPMMEWCRYVKSA